MVLLAAAAVATTAPPAIGPSVNGRTAAVVGLLLATPSRLGQSNSQASRMWGIVLVACAMGAVLGISAALLG